MRQKTLARTFAVAIALPLISVGVCSIARLVWSRSIGYFVDFGTVLGAGIVGCLIGSWILYRALRGQKARWVVALVLYDMAMPLAVFGLAVVVAAGGSR